MMTATEVLEIIFENGAITYEEKINVLEDGFALKKMGITDADAVEDAYNTLLNEV
jgi:hypothetical protein